MESYLSLPTSELLGGLVFSFGRKDGQDIWCVKRMGFSSSNLNFTGYRKHEARVVGRSNLPWKASILAEIGKVVDTGGLNQLRSGDTWCGSPGDLQWPHFVKGLYQVHNLTLQRERAKWTKSLTSADWPQVLLLTALVFAFLLPFSLCFRGWSVWSVLKPVDFQGLIQLAP
jgi:hypothetical protein